ncbi:MAG TPA: YceI family protein [Bryobacteraceae bacterium]|nr:YceI family protein [Bryobacteraceae bacterium]
MSELNVSSAGTDAALGQYLLDNNASRFTVRAFAGGMLAAMGHSPTIAIRDFSGVVNFDPAHLDPGRAERAALRMEIRADSLEVTDDIKRADRTEMESTMCAKVLETARYPAITFESAGAAVESLGEGRYRVTVTGKLSLHGVTRSLPLTTQMTITGGMLRASGDFSILQSDYGIARARVAGGALKLKDELKFAFDIVARKQG